MNKTQEKALNWLIQQGYKKEEITFRQKAPNFLTKDNRRFEVKRLYGTQIIFYNSQYQQLKKDPKITILVFRDNESSPFLKFKFEEIKSLPKIYKGIEINWVNLDEDIKAVRISKKTKDRLQSFGKMGENFDQLLNRLLDKIKDD
jgi:hypothetical protein